MIAVMAGLPTRDRTAHSTGSAWRRGRRGGQV